MNIYRLIIGLIVSPLVPAFLMGILHNNGAEIFVGTIISYILIFLILLPIHLELESKNKENFRNYLISGLIVGCLLSLIPLLFLLKPGITSEFLTLFVTTSIILTCTISIFSSFWVIVKG